MKELSDKEWKLIEYLRNNALSYGEILVRLIFQDNVVVLIKVEDRKETIKL